MTQAQERETRAGQINPTPDGKTVTGYAAKFGTWSQDLGGFVETITRGAFSNALQKSDVRALFNHDPNYVLARSAAGTLKLEEDEIGLKYEFSIPDTTFGRDFAEMLKRGDINQSSFGFTIAKGGQVWERGDGIARRTITAVDTLFDISPVTYPAYLDTSVALRSMGEALQPDEKDDDEKDDDLHVRAAHEYMANTLHILEMRAKQ